MTGDFDEFSLIAELFAPLATAPESFGLKDDAALLACPPGQDLVVTTDTLVAGVDFFPDDPPNLIARKALRVNLSDLAAKGAKPFSYLLNLSLPANIDRKWLEAFARGLAEDQENFGIALLGGDTGRVPGPCSISITAFGHVAKDRMIRREGARAGERVFVTGTIGDSGGGLAVLKGEGANIPAAQRDMLITRYRLPQPRLDMELHGTASAALDISDGLIADLDHLARASNVKLIIDAEKIPRSSALRALWGEGEQAILRAATAGDDYEIGFTAAAAPQTCTRIGIVADGSGVVLMMDGKVLPVPHPGYRHF